MKKKELDLIKRALTLQWKIEYIKPKTGRKAYSKKCVYQAGDIFKLVTNSQGNISGVSLRKPKKRAQPIANFMGIKPSYYVCGNSVHIVFLLGNEPCELHRLIFCLEQLGDKEHISSVFIEPIFDQCKCNEFGTAMLMSAAVAGIRPH
ncbi:MAG: hypothetical protein KTR16_16295 [Acidiferrobacterales bacterium]|nr:hypothetical protein [Acidiferrobacterales bacterium]